jgi:hypothetical protein
MFFKLFFKLLLGFVGRGVEGIYTFDGGCSANPNPKFQTPTHCQNPIWTRILPVLDRLLAHNAITYLAILAYTTTYPKPLSQLLKTHN